MGCTSAMTYLWAALALVALGVVGWRIHSMSPRAAGIARALVLVPIVLALFVPEGPAQGVVAAGLVGFILGNAVPELQERRKKAAAAAAAAAQRGSKGGRSGAREGGRPGGGSKVGGSKSGAKRKGGPPSKGTSRPKR